MNIYIVLYIDILYIYGFYISLWMLHYVLL